MQYRQLGQTGLRVSALGFGCGAVGGLMVNGARADMLRGIAHAIDQGITYFDTAPLYGNGLSEQNLGLVLEELKADVIVGTKVRPNANEAGPLGPAILQSVERSLKALRREQIDLIQLHNSLGQDRHVEGHWLSIDDVGPVIETFRGLQQAGKVRFWGINGLGETAAVHAALASGAQTVQSCFNLINPTAGFPAPAGFPFQDYRQLIDRAAERNVGVIAIRALAGGALSGSADRHPNAAAHVDPISSGDSFAADVAWARRFDFLVREGHAGSLPEAAIRFVIGKPEIATTLIGISSFEQLEQALDAANKPALPPDALARLQAVWRVA